jgi:hypothetical protein
MSFYDLEDIEKRLDYFKRESKKLSDDIERINIVFDIATRGKDYTDKIIGSLFVCVPGNNDLHVMDIIEVNGIPAGVTGDLGHYVKDVFNLLCFSGFYSDIGGINVLREKIKNQSAVGIVVQIDGKKVTNHGFITSISNPAGNYIEVCFKFFTSEYLKMHDIEQQC